MESEFQSLCVEEKARSHSELNRVAGTTLKPVSEERRQGA